MPDREKVIKNLQGFYNYLKSFENTAKMAEWVADALELLKEKNEGKYIPCKVKTETGKWDGEKCSVCGSTYLGAAPHKWRYYPDYGAKMEER